MQTNANHAG